MGTEDKKPREPEVRDEASGPVRQALRWVECLALFGGIPGIMILMRENIVGWLFPIMWTAAIPAIGLLLWDKSFDRRWMWNAHEFWPRLLRTLKVFVPLALIAVAFMWLFEPDRILSFPRRAFWLWVIVMVLYTPVAAYPQEIIYRAFFFHRYAPIFRTERSMVIASALAFGWGHAFLGTWVAFVFSAAGGWLFARTFARTRSLLQCTIEHGLWGDFMFTLGLGWYFYAGSMY